MIINETKYKLTVFENRFKTTGKCYEETFENIYLNFKNKIKRTKETYSEFISADRDTQARIKDVGGFIGGATENSERRNGIKVVRGLLTLDIDADKPNVLEYLERTTNFLCFVYSTHKHSPEKNRLRLVAPLSREVNADEYEEVGRRIAYKIETQNETAPRTELFDETTFQATRLMFFPSVSRDGEYICEMLNLDLDLEQTVIDVDSVLNEYLDKNNIFEWYKPRLVDKERSNSDSVTNKKPLDAKGMVGAFNRTYSISEAIEKFLPHIYKLENNGRYTYIPGDSYGGGIVLDNDTIFYSHHGTDPANMFYRNAFDLVRIHLFGDSDKTFTPEKEIQEGIAEQTESFKKMIEFCRSLPEVVEHSDSNIAQLHRLEEQEKYVSTIFEKDKPSEEKEQTSEETDDKKWLIKLDGEKSKMAKLDLIFTNDKNIGQNLLYYDTFRENICFARKPYWKQGYFNVGEPLQDKDMSHIRNYLEKTFLIKGDKDIDDAVVVEADKIQKNEVLEYFETLKWDGTDRLTNFFYDFFKTPKNPFTQNALKHWLTGAVARIYKAGSPMDLVLVLKGEQGIGKSLFFKKLATTRFDKPENHLYSDTKIDFDHAKDSYEQLEGIWIYEWKELAGMNMSEQESIKAFVDKTEDKFRRSYGRRNVEIRRRVAFGGTTNDKTPLRDRTGNRRFLVIESKNKRNECYIKDEKKFSQEYKDQMIAQAIHLYKSGYDYLNDWSAEEIDYWEKSNETNLAENDYYGIIDSYLSMKKPETWYSLNIEQMIQYYEDYDFERDEPGYKWAIDTKLYDEISVMEIWKVALGQRDYSPNRFQRELIISALTSLGWGTGIQQRKRFGVFGRQIPYINLQTAPLNKIKPVEEITVEDLF